MNLHILLADDHKILREGLRSLLENDPRYEVVAEADSGRSAVQSALKIRPDLIIMDITMPDLNGIEATRRILQHWPAASVLALSVHSDKRFILRMFEAGARGYLRKDCASDELIRAIETITAGERYLNTQMSGLTIDDVDRLIRRKFQHVRTIDGLTPREREVLQLVAEGNTSRDIAGMLGVSPKAIEKYRQNIMDKLNLHSVAELTQYAMNEGMTGIDS